MKAIEETGRINLAALGDLHALQEQARREGEADRRRVERLIEATSNALAMAHRATENAGAASAHAQQMIDESVAGIQRRMSDALVKECPNWLILEQKFRHREYAWKLATRVCDWRDRALHRRLCDLAILEPATDGVASGDVQRGRPVLV